MKSELTFTKARNLALILVIGATISGHGCDDASNVPLYNDWEITEETPLLSEEGTLEGWGWARHPHMIWNRDHVAETRRETLKEWDYYSILTPDFHLEVTMANISWIVLVTVSILDFETGESQMNKILNFDTSSLILPSNPFESISFGTSDHGMSYEITDTRRILTFRFQENDTEPYFEGEIIIEHPRSNENLAIAAPFESMDMFFYTNKIVGMPASGTAIMGDRTFEFEPGESWATLDWGRGVWPEQFEWTWGGGGGMVDGHPFGFNIGWGEEDTSHGTANSIVYDGVLHKLGVVDWEFDLENVMGPWRFSSDDGRFEIELEPVADGSSLFEISPYYMDVTKVYGLYSGHATLDDGTVLTIENHMGFAEFCRQRW